MKYQVITKKALERVLCQLSVYEPDETVVIQAGFLKNLIKEVKVLRYKRNPRFKSKSFLETDGKRAKNIGWYAGKQDTQI